MLLIHPGLHLLLLLQHLLLLLQLLLHGLLLSRWLLLLNQMRLDLQHLAVTFIPAFLLVLTQQHKGKLFCLLLKILLLLVLLLVLLLKTRWDAWVKRTSSGSLLWQQLVLQLVQQLFLQGQLQLLLPL